MGKQIGNMLLEFFNTPNDRYGREYGIISNFGYIYAPYIPLHLDPVYIEQVVSNMHNKISSRYSSTTINQDFYGRIQI